RVLSPPRPVSGVRRRENPEIHVQWMDEERRRLVPSPARAYSAPMPAPKLIVTAPLLSVSRNVPVAAGTNGAWRALAARATMDAAALGAVRGAREAKAEVVAVLAVEPALAATVRAEVEALGATADLVEVGSASLRHSRYV